MKRNSLHSNRSRNSTPETTLLVDTYDTLAGCVKSSNLARHRGPLSSACRAIRFRGLGRIGRGYAKELDEAGLQRVKIFASSGLDEYKILELITPVRRLMHLAWGKKLAVVADAPDLDMAYKLVEYGGKGRLKLSAKKLLYPGRKQVFRQIENGQMAEDVIGRFDEPLAGERLLKPLFLCGQPVTRIELTESRKCLQSELKRLPDHLRGLQAAPTSYPVHFQRAIED